MNIELNEEEANAILDVIAKATHTEKSFQEVWNVTSMIQRKFAEKREIENNTEKPIMAKVNKE